jgi:hypothetical protein
LDKGVVDKILDESRLGAAKIEKYVVEGTFLAPKQYMLNYFMNGKVNQMIKVKGVQNKFMNEDKFKEMVPDNLDESFETNYDWAPRKHVKLSATHVVTEKWHRSFTGIVKTPIIKLLTANHKKRLFDTLG